MEQNTSDADAKLNEEKPRLVFFRAKDLFGQYDNKIELKTNERITAIIGPNGRGKTVCLRLIDAFYHRRYSTMVNIAFSSLEYRFDNGCIVTVRKVDPAKKRLAKTDPEILMDGALPLELTFIDSKGKRHKWHPVSKLNPVGYSSITRVLPFLTRSSPTSWTDDRTGERYSLFELSEKFGELLPKGILLDGSSSAPAEFKELIAGVDCHFIETQRLLVLSADESRWVYDSRGAKRASTDAKLVVEQKALKLRELLQKQLADFGTVSQVLDRSFPRRVIHNSNTQPISQEEVGIRLQKLEDERRALKKAGLLDVELDTLFMPERFDDRMAGILSVYINDTEHKLNVFSGMRKKIDLFVEIITDRFVGKTITISQKNGFTIQSAATGDEIPLDKLSSGEQHQLVLVFELLFEMSRNSVILIDEPELSLHVRWQKKFISDLRRIIDLNRFDVVLATHSPQLISHWRELIVSLGSVYKG